MRINSGEPATTAAGVIVTWPLDCALPGDAEITTAKTKQEANRGMRARIMQSAYRAAFRGVFCRLAAGERLRNSFGRIGLRVRGLPGCHAILDVGYLIGSDSLPDHLPIGRVLLLVGPFD